MFSLKKFFSLTLILLALSSSTLAAYATDDIDIYVNDLRNDILSRITGAPVADPENPIVKTESILKYGAKGDGVKDCRPAFMKAMREAEKRGGLRIEVPAGVYFIAGPLTLTSNVCIHLSEGATLKFSPDPACYPIVSTSWEGTYLYNYSPMIYGYGLENVAITGSGTIDGNAADTFATWRPKQGPAKERSRDMNHNAVPLEERRFGEGDFLRPHLIQLYNCSAVTLEGVKIINSPFWCVHLLRSENIVCKGLRYDAKLVNNDGIDPESSRYILIEDIEFDNGDDNVAIKSGRDDDGRSSEAPCENILIRNCRFKGLHAVVIGSEMSAGVRNVIVENCTYAGYCKRSIYVKTNPDRGGFVNDIYVRDCEFDEVEDLFYITSCYAGEGMNNHYFSKISDIHVDGLRCRKASKAALVVQGTLQEPVRKVSFNHVEVGEAVTAISFTNSEDVKMRECVIGPAVDSFPTLVTPTDNLFNR